MISRALLVLLGCALVTAAHAASDTYQRSETFKSAPKNWRYFNPNQGFGYFPTNNSKGLAGGFFFPKTYTAYYGDTSLNGVFHRDTPIFASGTIRFDEISFDPNYTNSVYIAHFRKGSTYRTFVNIIGIALTGTGQGTVNCRPIVQFSNGDAFIGGTIVVPVDSITTSWSYKWTPNAGGLSLGQLEISIGDSTRTLTLNKTSAGFDYTLDSFGLYQPAFVAPNSNSYLVYFVGDLEYTALLGPAPKIRIKGPKNIQTSSASVSLAGTSRTTLGNKVQRIRYRVVQGKKTGSYRRAKGIDQWSANVTVPLGKSRIEVTATGDNGRTKTATRNVTRLQ